MFPRLEGDVVVAAVGPDVTQVALRGKYQPPLGRIGRALDRVMLHRVAESSVRLFVECIADAVRYDAEDVPVTGLSPAPP